jgi:toxin ParE1/3/4
MSRKVIWAPKALADFDGQIAHIAGESRQNALLVADRIEAAVEGLAKKPLGRPGRLPGIYEKSVLKTSLIIAYELPGPDELHILRVIHSSRHWPGGEWPKDDV